jgi:hypothetical protein
MIGIGGLAFLSALIGCSARDYPTQTRSESRADVKDATQLPDLIVMTLTVDGVTPNSISYSYTIQNIGDGPADLEGPTGSVPDNVSVQAFLSHDTIFNNADDVAAGGTVVVFSSPAGVLNPGETLSGSFGSGFNTPPAPTADPCDYEYLVMKVDWGEVEAESDEANNTLAAPIDCGPQIDIKPDSDINPINPKNKGVIPVVIYGSATVDVTDIDQSSLAFGPDGAGIAHDPEHFADINEDGLTDLMLHFRTQETGIHAGDTEACLTGDFLGGGSFTACDNIITVPVEGIALYPGP